MNDQQLFTSLTPQEREEMIVLALMRIQRAQNEAVYLSRFATRPMRVRSRLAMVAALSAGALSLSLPYALPTLIAPLLFANLILLAVLIMLPLPPPPVSAETELA